MRWTGAVQVLKCCAAAAQLHPGPPECRVRTGRLLWKRLNSCSEPDSPSSAGGHVTCASKPGGGLLSDICCRSRAPLLWLC